MFVSLIFIIANTLDPRLAKGAEFYTGIVKLLVGTLLGFVIILLYGVGFPGLKYIFVFIGVGGILHLFLSEKYQDSYRVS